MMQSKLPPSFKAGKLSREEVRARLRVADQPKASMSEEDPVGAQFILNVMEIRTYDKNPRQAVYEDYPELKESIRRQGFHGAFPVTRRPEEKAYMLAQGYNQRLRAVQELWQETGEAKYRNMPVVYVAWTTESDNQARHLSENLTRSDMTFWDKATGLLSFKQQREIELGAELTLRRLEEEAKRAGLNISIATLSLYLFTAQTFAPLRNEIRPSLTYNEVKAIQPALNRLRIVLGRLMIQQPSAFDIALSSVIEAANREFISSVWSAQAFIQACETRAAELARITPNQLTTMLSLMDRFPSLSREELLQASSKALPGSGDTHLRRGRRSKAATDTTAPSAGDRGVQVVGNRDPMAFPGESEAPTGSPCAPSAGKKTQHSVPAQNPEAMDGPASEADVVDLLNRIWLQAAALSAAAQVDDLLRREEAMPAGFYVEVQPAEEPNLDFDPREHRHSGWWMLAAVSGQMDQALSGRLPESSTWRRAHQNEDPDLTLSFVVQERLGMFCYLPSVVPWLTEPGHPIGEAYYALLGLLRQLRAAAPARFTDVGDAR
jgi:ParB family protein of integrating conjugative element (PFGI_1 class)